MWSQLLELDLRAGKVMALPKKFDEYRDKRLCCDGVVFNATRMQ